MILLLMGKNSINYFKGGTTMARPDSALSLELERSMNMQVRVATFEEHLRQAQVISDLDRERRVKSFNLNK